MRASVTAAIRSSPERPLPSWRLQPRIGNAALAQETPLGGESARVVGDAARFASERAQELFGVVIVGVVEHVRFERA